MLNFFAKWLTFRNITLSCNIVASINFVKLFYLPEATWVSLFSFAYIFDKRKADGSTSCMYAKRKGRLWRLRGFMVSIVESMLDGLSNQLINLLIIALIKSFKKYHKIIIPLPPNISLSPLLQISCE